MRNVVVERFLDCDHGTFSFLHVKGFTFFSLEPEWRENAHGVSCIPAGEYVLRRTIYNRYNYPTYEVVGIPDRERILLHPGNTEEDTEGCVLLGMTLGVLTVDRDLDTGKRNKKLAVLQSRKAFDQFMRLMDGITEARITVVEV